MIPQFSATSTRRAMRWALDERRLSQACQAVLEFMQRHPIAATWWRSDLASSDMMTMETTKRVWQARCYVLHHLSLNRRLQPAVRQGQFLHSSQTSAGHRRRKIGRYSFAIVGSSQAFHGYQKRPAYEPHGICDR